MHKQGEKSESTEQEYNGPTQELRLLPANSIRIIPRVKTALQLLRNLGLRPTDALVIRRNTPDCPELLTPDRRLDPDDIIEVRVVTSSG